MNKKIIVISDVDGCLTDGKFIYTVDGKVAKTFGPHDADGVKLLKKCGIDIIFISADKRGFAITEKRITDMGCRVVNVSEAERAEWVANYKRDNNYDIAVFFGDGISDIKAGYLSNYFVCPKNARPEVKTVADYVTLHNGGEGAFLDLTFNIIKKYIGETIVNEYINN